MKAYKNLHRKKVAHEHDRIGEIMNALVGYTGFVGSNLFEKGAFDKAYNTCNISEAYGTAPDLLVYAGLRAEKYLANRDPAGDMERILEAEKNIEKINPGKLVLISTIDVFEKPSGVDENTVVDANGLQAYGYNRFQLERWAVEHYPDLLIIRLPALYGKNLKKNFIYDYIHVIPMMLNEGKFKELYDKEPVLGEYYHLSDNGFYKATVPDEKKEEVKGVFRKLGFSALNFTDSRSRFQFYNLNRLWDDLRIVMDAGIRLWHPATEPVSARELYRFLTGEEFINELKGTPADYDYRSIYAGLFGGRNGYICSRMQVLEDIKKFIEG